MSTVSVRDDGPISIVSIERPHAKNAIDGPTAAALIDAFEKFEANPAQRVAVLTGTGGTFCAGADLKNVATIHADAEGDGPLGPTRRLLDKPVIAAVEGHAVAGGLELALWCDLRVAAKDAVFGVFCRRWGVPLLDGGTVRLPRIVGLGVALDLILTGRGVSGDEALRIGLANRLTETGNALAEAIALAKQLAAFPQECLRADRRSAYEAFGQPLADALRVEARRGHPVLGGDEIREGIGRYVGGAGRHGAF
jgi:enoyl-CoA hydratase